MLKFLLVSLLQAVIAQNFPGARPYARTNINNRNQFYLRDPGNLNLGYNTDTVLKTEDLSYSSDDPQNKHNYYKPELPNHGPLINEQTAIKNDEYVISNVPEGDHYSKGNHNRDGSDVSGKVKTSNHRYHRINTARPNTQYRANYKVETANTGFISQSNTYGDHSDLIETNYGPSDDHHGPEQQVRTNQDTTEYTGVMRAANENIELTTVPVVLLMSVTLKTNPNIHNGFAMSDTVNDSLVEVRHNRHSITFSDIDNRQQDTLDKTTTDNEIRLSKNDTDDEKWIWSDVTTTTTTEKVLPDGGLDDRTSLTGDGCPTGQAKVKGICTPTH